MSDKVEIKRMVIEMGGKEVELSVDDARKLLAALKEVLNEPKEKEYVPYPQPHYVPYYVEPWRPRPYWWGSTYVYCSTAGTMTGNTLRDGHTVNLSLKASDAISIR